MLYPFKLAFCAIPAMDDPSNLGEITFSFDTCSTAEDNDVFAGIFSSFLTGNVSLYVVFSLLWVLKSGVGF